MRLFSVRRKTSTDDKQKGGKHIGKKVLIVTGIMLALFMAAPVANNTMLNNMTGTMTTYAAETATFSQYWFQDAQGNWKVQDGNGNIVKNAWLCDDAVTSNGKDVWYLLDSNGCMVTAGLVQDGTGNFYSLETNHNGFYGMLRYKSGNYDGVNLTLEGSHSGAFAAVLNQDGLAALQAKYGVTSVSNINNANCVYTSTFGSGGGGSRGSSGTTTSNQNNTSQTQSQVQNGGSKSFADVFHGDDGNYTGKLTSWDEMSPETQQALINASHQKY